MYFLEYYWKIDWVEEFIVGSIGMCASYVSLSLLMMQIYAIIYNLLFRVITHNPIFGQ